MKPFKITEIKKINELPNNDSQSWLVDAEGSIAFLRLNLENDDIVIYASGSSVLIHGVLAPTAKLTPPDGKDLQDNNMDQRAHLNRKLLSRNMRLISYCIYCIIIST